MVSRAALIPTPRAALLVVAAAPAALLLAAFAPAGWAAAPVLALAVLVVVLGDALAAGRLTEFTVDTLADTEVGEEGWITIEVGLARSRASAVACALAADPRLLAGGRGEGQLVALGAGKWRAGIPLYPTRRGTGTLERAWIRWTGPLGLGARQIEQALSREVRVWPNVAPVRAPSLQAFLKNVETGMIARRIRGEGSQFEALAEYEPGMDRRRIDWKSSARHAHLYAKEYEAERNNQIVFAFDCGQAMCEPVGGLPRIDRAVTAALTTAYVALKGGDRVSLYGFAARPEVFTPFVSDTREFRRLQMAAAGLDYQAQEPNFTLALATLAGRLARRSLIVVFSDFTDPTSAQLMIESIGRLTQRHLVLFVTMADEELEDIAAAAPTAMPELTQAVAADSLLRQRALVLSRLRALGVDVIEAPYNRIGLRLIDAYLAIKRKGAIG
ncbi:DUF58 domain-containing protein [Novosphingobium sp.]|uniref:DUF58 domain-containing protein n=1 Tax=Novosphingobium sp. TaxID=1874826 RepID=UPI0035AE9F4E